MKGPVAVHAIYYLPRTEAEKLRDRADELDKRDESIEAFRAAIAAADVAALPVRDSGTV